MPHFRVDDALNSHPKARKAGLEAMGLWAVSGAFCQAYLTDGFVPAWYVKTWPKGMVLAKRLIAAGLWLPAERDGENGWLFHEWLKVQDSKEQIEADREKWRKKKQAQRESRGDSPSVSPGDKSGDMAGESRESPGYTQPNPTQEEISGYVQSSPCESDATSSRDDLSPPVNIGATRLVERAIPPSAVNSATRTGLRIEASQLLASGETEIDVQAALSLWLTKPDLGVKALKSLMAEVYKQRASPGANGKSTSKVRGYAELAQQVRVEESAAQIGTLSYPRELT